MARMRNWRALAILFVFVAVFTASFALLTSEPAAASRCDCWVMYCTVEPPIYCWCECVPCPPIFP